MASEFGKFLRKERVSKRKFIKDVAEELEWSSTYISDIEIGDRPPPIDKEKLLKWAEILDIDADTLITLADKERKVTEIELGKGEKKDALSLKVARNIDYISEQNIDRILKIIDDGGDDE